MWETLLGGSLTLLGGWAAIYFQFRYARKNKMNEIVAERKVTTNAQAYAYMKEIKSIFTQKKDAKAAVERILRREEWFFDNRLFLPGEFPSKWLSVRNDLLTLARSKESNTGTPEELTALNNRIESTCTEAIMEIYKDMDLKPIVLQNDGA
jgi:hypothetical protein